MPERIAPGHRYSYFERVVVNGRLVSRVREPKSQRWEMERAIHVIEELLETDTAGSRKGLHVMIDWWAPQFMRCDAPELRERFATILGRAYSLRHLESQELRESK